jgi:hypothetical protein
MLNAGGSVLSKNIKTRRSKQQIITIFNCGYFRENCYSICIIDLN